MAVMESQCPSDEALAEFAENALEESMRSALDAHLDRCEMCRKLVAFLGRQKSTLNDTPSTVETVSEVPTRRGATPKLPTHGEVLPQARRLFEKPVAFDSTELPAEIGRFQVRAELGRGGMGVVYRAYDPTLRRDVAVKVLHAGGSDELSARLLREARSMARLSHPNVVPIFEVGDWQGRVFLAMEFVEGENLRAYQRRRPPWRDILRILLDAGRGLAAAHKRNIVHRDFKPDNVLIGADGVARVTDFGLAQALVVDDDDDENPGSTRSEAGTGVVMGTPAYMPPEQYNSEAPTAASDLFSFCVTLFEALFGTRPFTGKDMLQVRIAVLEGTIAEVSLGEIPADLHAAVVQGLSREPGARPPSMDVLLARLEEFVTPRTLQDQPYPGLVAFSERHVGLYFGREREVAAAHSRLEQKALLGIVGTSGAGKSSFVRAGLLPRLQSDGPWRMIRMRPGRNPMSALRQCLDPFHSQAAGAHLDSVGHTLTKQRKRDGVRSLLLVDQLEEVFTQCSDTLERQEFLSELLAATDAPWWGAAVVTLRSDFIDYFSDHRQFLESLTENLLYLSPLDHDGLRRALEEPAKAFSFRFEDSALVEQIVDELTATRGALPLLQFAAAELWRSRDVESRTLTRASYERMGEIGGALARHADGLVLALPSDDQALARALLERLVTPEGTRDSISDEEVDSLATGTRTRELLTSFIDALLIVAHEDDNGRSYELIHESLISSWPALRRWLDESRDDVAYRGQIRAAARQWDQRKRVPGLLWTGAAAHDLRRWRERSTSTLPEVEDSFVKAVLSAHLRSARRKRSLVVGVVTALSLAVAGTGIGLVSVNQANQRAQKEAVRARAEADRATAAEERTKLKVTELEREKAVREAAEKRAVEAAGEANLSREQLQAALVKSRQATEAAVAASKSAQSATRAAQASASAEAKVRKQVEALLREKSRQLEIERKRRKRIVDGDLAK